MNTAKFLTRCAFSLAVIAVFAISTADAQQRRQERRPDSNPNRTNVHCELNFWDARSARDIQEAR